MLQGLEGVAALKLLLLLLLRLLLLLLRLLLLRLLLLVPTVRDLWTTGSSFGPQDEPLMVQI